MRGEEYALFRVKDSVYGLSITAFYEVRNFYEKCGFSYAKFLNDGVLVFCSCIVSIRIELFKAERSVLQLEKLLLETKQKKSMLAIHTLFDNQNIYSVKSKNDSEMQLEKEITCILLGICVKLAQNNAYMRCEENVRNDYIRDMLGIALRSKEFSVKDQTRTGISASGKSAGEADIVIFSGKDLPYAYIEGLNLSSFNYNYITEHVERLFKYDRIGVGIGYLVNYITVKDFAGFVAKYMQAVILNTNYSFELIGINDCKNEYSEYLFSNLRIIKTSFNRNNRIMDIYHILLLI